MLYVSPIHFGLNCHSLTLPHNLTLEMRQQPSTYHAMSRKSLNSHFHCLSRDLSPQHMNHCRVDLSQKRTHFDWVLEFLCHHTKMYRAFAAPSSVDKTWNDSWRQLFVLLNWCRHNLDSWVAKFYRQLRIRRSLFHPVKI